MWIGQQCQRHEEQDKSELRVGPDTALDIGRSSAVLLSFEFRGIVSNICSIYILPDTIYEPDLFCCYSLDVATFHHLKPQLYCGGVYSMPSTSTP